MGKPNPLVRKKPDPADADAPAGGGGPGFFAYPLSRMFAVQAPPFPQQRQAPATRHLTPSAGAAATKTPPTTVPLMRPVKVEKTAFVDIDVSVEVLGDGKNAQSSFKGAKTPYDLAGVQWEAPGYAFKIKNGIKWVTKLNGPFVLKGKITIQTTYGPAAEPKSPSLYGRGTTPEDKANGDTTLGFHEHCHREDYLMYLQNNALPGFEGTVDMSEAGYQTAKKKFGSELQKFFDRMRTYTEKNTDEVGHTRSQCLRDGKCS